MKTSHHTQSSRPSHSQAAPREDFSTLTDPTGINRIDATDKVEKHISEMAAVDFEDWISVPNSSNLSFHSNFHQETSLTNIKTPHHFESKPPTIHHNIQTSNPSGFTFNSSNLEFRPNVHTLSTSQQRQNIADALNAKSIRSERFYHGISGVRTPHIKSLQRTAVAQVGSQHVLLNSALDKPTLERNQFINNLQEDFTPFSMQEAIKISQNQSLIQSFRYRASRKPSSNKRYNQKIRFFIREYMNKTNPNFEIQDETDLSRYILESNNFQHDIENYLFARALSGTAPKTIAGDFSALKSLWKEVKHTNFDEIFPHVKETFKAIEQTFSRITEKSKGFRFQELHTYFNEASANSPSEKLLICAQKLGFIFTVRPTAILNLRKPQFTIEKVIMDLNKSRQVGKIRVFDAKTNKNAKCYQDHYSNTHQHGFNIKQIRNQILHLREENKEDYLFFSEGKKLSYSDGYKFFQDKIQQFKRNHPEYKNMKFTPGSFRVSSMIVTYKYDKKIINKIKQKAIHSAKSNTTEKSYLSKDPTLLFCE